MREGCRGPERESWIPDEDFLVGYEDAVEQWAVRYERAAQASRELWLRPISIFPAYEWTAFVAICGVLLHVIEETARHAGHADIISETLDGATAISIVVARV